jgi:hypothetical protein
MRESALGSPRPAQHNPPRTSDLADESAALAYAVIARAREARASARAARRKSELLRAQIRRQQGLPGQREQ